jgi:transcriptional regulator with XRE-family HTH domain
MTEQTLSAADNDTVSGIVREALARQRITRQYLADQAKISLSTLEKALSGQRPFTLASIVRLEAALGVPLRPQSQAKSVDRANGVAPEELGSYARPAVSWIEGSYLTLRPSFSSPGAIYAYLTDIGWNDESSHLVFAESERIDAAFTQQGNVSIPHQSGFIYLVTNKFGQYRMIVVSRPTITGEMFGLLTTLQSGRGTNLFPVSTPIVLAPLKRLAARANFGRIEKGHARYPHYSELVHRAVDENFAMLIAR